MYSCNWKIFNSGPRSTIVTQFTAKREEESATYTYVVDTELVDDSSLRGKGGSGVSTGSKRRNLTGSKGVVSVITSNMNSEISPGEDDGKRRVTLEKSDWQR